MVNASRARKYAHTRCVNLLKWQTKVNIESTVSRPQREAKAAGVVMLAPGGNPPPPQPPQARHTPPPLQPTHGRHYTPFWHSSRRIYYVLPKPIPAEIYSKFGERN